MIDVFHQQQRNFFCNIPPNFIKLLINTLVKVINTLYITVHYIRHEFTKLDSRIYKIKNVKIENVEVCDKVGI